MAETLTTESKMTKVDLFPMFKKGIAKQYPENEGWKVYNRFNWVSYLHDFVLQRELDGLTERVVVEIVTDRKVRDEQISQLIEVAGRLEYDGTRVSKKIMVVADETDTSCIPADIEVYYLGEFLKNGLASAKTVDKAGSQSKLVA